MAASFKSTAPVLIAANCIIALLFPTIGSAQNCTPDLITLSSQDEVDNFQLNHGPCDRVESLIIEGPGIINLGGLSGLTSSGKSLSITDNADLTNIDGLSNLTTVGGGMRITRNAALTNLDGLSALNSVRSNLIIENNDALANVNGLFNLPSVSNLHITGNGALANVDGLSAITSLVASLHILDNNVLTNVNGLSALTNVGDLKIDNNMQLTNLDGLSSLTSMRALYISAPVTHVNFMSNIGSLSGDLTIEHADALTDVDGLAALQSVGSLFIWTNDVLTNLDGLSALTSVSNHVRIFLNNSLENINGLSALTSVGDKLLIQRNARLKNLDGLSALTDVSGDMSIQLNAALTTVNGLSALTNLGAELRISGNNALTNLDGLSALQRVQNLIVQYNAALIDCQGLVQLVDPLDDYEPGPGPGSAGIPDVANQVVIQNNSQGCGSVLDILGQVPLHMMNAGLNDAWFNLDTNGQGFLIITFPEIQQMFMSWFTYDTERPPEEVAALLGEPGHRWLTAQGGYVENIAALDIFVTSGGVFDSPEPGPNTESDGEIMIEFSTCNAGTVTYDIPSVDRQGVIPIERIVLDNVSLCYMLNSELKDEVVEQ